MRANFVFLSIISVTGGESEPTRALKARPTLLTDVVPLQIPMFLFFGVQFRGRLPDVSFDKHISGLIILAVATTASVSHN